MHDAPVATVCLNCGRDLHGVYCSHCGQRVASFTLGLHDFFHELTHEFLHLDGKVFRTMKTLVFRPGALTREFVEGKRARYISPIRLYLTWSVVFFSLMLIFGETTKWKYTVNPQGKSAPGVEASTGSAFEKRLAEGAEAANRDPGKTGEAIVHAWPKAMFILMPFFAAVVMLLYRKAQRFYIPHLYYSIHLHAFAFFVLSISLLLGALHLSWLTPLRMLLVIALVPYCLYSLRHVYGGSWLMTILKGGAMTFIYLLLLAVTMIGVVMTTLLMV